MKKIALLLAFLGPLSLFAQDQNKIIVNLKSGAVEESKPFDAAKPFDLVFTQLEELGNSKNIKVRFTYPTASIPDQTFTNPATDNSISQYSQTTRLANITITLSKTVGESQKIITRFTITPTGKVTRNNLDDFTHENEMVYTTMPSKPDFFIPPAYTKHKVVVYDPCTNIYKIRNNGNERSALWLPFWLKKEKEKEGVIFLITDFNMLKYNVSLSSSFVSQNTEIPELFNSISTLISGGAVQASSTDKNLKEKIYKIAQLNSDLKKILGANCLDFEKAKKEVSNTAAINFANKNGILSLDEEYNTAKQNVIAFNKATNPAYGDKEVNNEFKTLIHLPIDPDSLVTETIQLYNLLMSTTFEYQSNIIQLQNADELQYTLTIEGKKDTKNTTIHLNNQLIRIPILGGIKIDFSTGFYYSNIKNEKYALRDKQINDTTVKKEIINEGSFKGGTLGVAALMHIYPKISKDFNVALTLGLGKAIDLNYSVLLGGSLIFGRDNRLVFSGGLNISNIQVLSQGNYDASGNRILLPAAATDVKFDNKFMQGAFVSFTYSLFGKKAQTASSSSGKEEEK